MPSSSSPVYSEHSGYSSPGPRAVSAGSSYTGSSRGYNSDPTVGNMFHTGGGQDNPTPPYGQPSRDDSIRR